MQPGFVAAGTPFRQLHRSDSMNAARATWAGGPGNFFLVNPSTGEERPPIESQSYRVGRVFAICFLTGPADPGLVKPLLATRFPA